MKKISTELLAAIVKSKRQELKLTKEKEAHHWNYNEGYEENIFILTKSQHKQIHAKMFLDIEFLVYRTKNAELLDTREKHENYINKFLI